MKRNFLAALAIASMAGQLIAGDLKITFKNEKVFMLMTQKSEETCYYSARYIRKISEENGTDTLFDYKNLIEYRIYHAEKTIYIYKLDDMLKIAEIKKNKLKTASPAEKKEMEKERKDKEEMFGGTNDVVKAEQIGTETIAERACIKWEITVGKKKIYTASAAPTLELPIPKADLERAKGNMLEDENMSLFLSNSDASSKRQAEVAKIKGFPLKTEWTVTSGLITVKARREATKIEEGP
ncbi:MAG: hypothetical protein LBC63_09220, partial [Holophagales bacterium]|nr:hypothetical protein [Holophagales bacterium]